MDKKSEIIEKYKKFRQLNGDKKLLRTDFLKFSKISSFQLDKAFGKDSYSKLQQACGDSPNKLEMERTPIETILNQYGELVRAKQEIPVSADWLAADYSPQPDGLRKIHGLKWVDMPDFFLKHMQDNIEWLDVVEILKPKSSAQPKTKSNKTFDEIVQKISDWRPDRKRIIEEGYKIELRNYLERFFDLEEETGESNPDLLLNKKYPIEIKKDPTQSEYDRLLGQMIRHNKIFGSAIAIVTSVSSEDRFRKFQKLFNEVHEKLGMSAEVIMK